MNAPLTTAADPAPYHDAPDELARLHGENTVLRNLLGECAAVLATLDEDDSDEAEKLADLLVAIDVALLATETEGALL